MASQLLLTLLLFNSIISTISTIQSHAEKAQSYQNGSSTKEAEEKSIFVTKLEDIRSQPYPVNSRLMQILSKSFLYIDIHSSVHLPSHQNNPNPDPEQWLDTCS